MSGTGAALQGHHAALREGLSELRARRDELSGRIRAEEAERDRLQARIATLSRRLSDTSENLAGLRSTRAHIDRTIAEMDIASGQILDNSQTLLDVLKKEMGDLGKAIDPQNTSLGQRIRRQKHS
ncbi:microtubule nucleation factor SSNA1 [Vidua macroura]|nr:microtubule nucleation factor SSNA1 [Vidua chalybeata]XP_053852219.1 microtubule nucleation factor SSNA1 [Vidua macroura]